VISGKGVTNGVRYTKECHLLFWHLSPIVTTTESNVQVTVAVAGTLSAFSVTAAGSPGGTNTFVVTVRKNAVDTTVTCTVPSAGTTCTSANSVAFAVGDKLSVSYLPSGGSKVLYFTANYQ
jgi:hypothetical protein